MIEQFAQENGQTYKILFYTLVSIFFLIIAFFLVGIILLIVVHFQNYIAGKTTMERVSRSAANSDID